MALGGIFCDSGVAVATVFSGSLGFVKPSFPLFVSPFESSFSDVSGGLSSDGVADDLGVEVAVSAMEEGFGFDHRDLSSW
jgi:hypothetical protein